MFHLIPYLSALSTLLGLLFFIGIVFWAWSSKRKVANNISAGLPFALPDEFDAAAGIEKIWEKEVSITDRYSTSHDTVNKKMTCIQRHRKETR